MPAPPRATARTLDYDSLHRHLAGEADELCSLGESHADEGHPALANEAFAHAAALREVIAHIETMAGAR